MISLHKEWNIKTKWILRTGSRFDISLFSKHPKKNHCEAEIVIKVLPLTKGGRSVCAYV
jgi:hypothetical protein